MKIGPKYWLVTEMKLRLFLLDRVFWINYSSDKYKRIKALEIGLIWDISLAN